MKVQLETGGIVVKLSVPHLLAAVGYQKGGHALRNSIYKSKEYMDRANRSLLFRVRVFCSLQFFLCVHRSLRSLLCRVCVVFASLSYACVAHFLSSCVCFAPYNP
jgi:hypothetical protein